MTLAAYNRKIFFSLAGILCAMVLAGCGAKTQTGQAGTSTAGTKTPITFTYFYNMDPSEDMPFTDPVAKKITQLTGVTLEVDHPIAGDRQAVPLMIASGDYPDIIFGNLDLPALIEAGAIIPLDDLIERKGENVKWLYGDQLKRLRNSLADPRIYSLGTKDVKTAKWTTDGTIQVQHEVLKELGYPRIETLEDLERALKAYKAKYPTVNGLPTLGISMVLPFWGQLSVGNTSSFMLGFPDDGEWIVNPTTLEATYKYMHPGMDFFIRWLNRMHTEGYFDPESFTQTLDVWEAKVASGRVLAISMMAWFYRNARQSLIAEGQPERTYAFLPIMAGPQYKSAALKDPGFAGGYGISITTSCKDPERAFEFLDWMCSEEAQILVNWGIEGLNYDVANGRRILREEDRYRMQNDPDYIKETGVGRWAYPFPMKGQGYIDERGNYMTPNNPETIKEALLPVERETLAAYGAAAWTDLFPDPQSLGISPYGEAWLITLTPEMNVKYNEAHDLTESAIGNLIAAKPSEFDSQWEKYQRDLRNIGMEEANAAMTQLIRDKVKMWND